jgi:hypothetical protein
MLYLFIKYKGSFSCISKAILLYLFSSYATELIALCLVRVLIGDHKEGEEEDFLLYKWVSYGIYVQNKLVFMVYAFVVA